MFSLTGLGCFFLNKMRAQSCVHFCNKHPVCFRVRAHNYRSLIPLQNRTVSIGLLCVQFKQVSQVLTKLEKRKLFRLQ